MPESQPAEQQPAPQPVPAEVVVEDDGDYTINLDMYDSNAR
ncbi:hypothetical protein [Streptomyces sp. NPDC096339]